MLSCVLKEKKVVNIRCKSKFSKNLNNNATSCDEVHSIATNTSTIKSKNKFPTLNRVNGWLSSNQNASLNLDSQSNKSTKVEVISSRKIKFDSVDNEDKKKQISIVFVKNVEKQIFKLTFNAINCNVIPLYTKERPFLPKDTEKNFQSYSKSFFVERYTPHLAKLFTRRKDFLVNHKNQGRESVMSFRQKIGTSRKTESKPPKTNVGISANRSNIKQSIIYLEVQNINFRLYPKAMTVDFSKPLSNEQLLNNLVRDLGLETIDQKKNKGSIIAKFDSDILKFTFSMEDISYQRVREKVTRATQIEDECIYMRSFSEISNKVIYIPIPMKIYNYRDPMVNARRNNRYMDFHHVDPRWLTETRQKRLSESKKCQQLDPGKKAYDSTSGSSIIYEGPGTLNKARDGLLHCEISDEDKPKYDRWISQIQNENLPTIGEGDDFEKFDSTSGQEVPDWDLIVYNK